MAITLNQLASILGMQVDEIKRLLPGADPLWDMAPETDLTDEHVRGYISRILVVRGETPEADEPTVAAETIDAEAMTEVVTAAIAPLVTRLGEMGTGLAELEARVAARRAAPAEADATPADAEEVEAAEPDEGDDLPWWRRNLEIDLTGGG